MPRKQPVKLNELIADLFWTEKADENFRNSNDEYYEMHSILAF